MSFFRFAVYFLVLVGCAVAAFPYWAPAGADAEAPFPMAYAASPSYVIVYKKSAKRYHLAAPARLASRD